jgi:peptidoglycan-N-acetylglucosamine deacetylase
VVPRAGRDEEPTLHTSGQTLIGWTTRGFDSTTSDGAVVLRRLMSGVRPGAIVVMHQGRIWSTKVVAHVVDELQKRGYSFVVPEAGRLKTK